MTTVINNPGDGSDSSASIVILVIVLLIAAAVFFIYGLPAIRGSRVAPQNGSIDVNVKLPAGAISPAPAPTTPAN